MYHCLSAKTLLNNFTWRTSREVLVTEHAQMETFLKFTDTNLYFTQSSPIKLVNVKMTVGCIQLAILLCWRLFSGPDLSLTLWNGHSVC